MICWLCEKETQIKETDFGDHRCPHCGVEISIYNPADYRPISPDGGERKEEMPNVNDLKVYLCPTDVKDGDILKLKDAGEFVERDFSKEQDGSDIKTVLEMTIELPNGKTKKCSPNSRSRDALAEGFGSPNSEDWVGKEVSVMLVKQNVFGSIKNIIYLEPVK